MKNNFIISIVFLVALFNVFPPLFAEGGVFAVAGPVVDYSGNIVKIEGVHYDNVYFSYLYALLTYVSLFIPFVLPKMNKKAAFISMISGAWFFSALLFEVFNFTIPDIVLNSDKERTMYVRFVVTFTVTILTIIIRETWTRTTKLEK
jgi:hypothetical protein